MVKKLLLYLAQNKNALVNAKNQMNAWYITHNNFINFGRYDSVELNTLNKLVGIIDYCYTFKDDYFTYFLPGISCLVRCCQISSTYTTR